jgi:hypothetical protein
MNSHCIDFDMTYQLSKEILIVTFQKILIDRIQFLLFCFVLSSIEELRNVKLVPTKSIHHS